MFGQSVVFEAAGYSLLGPLALNCAAPDEGNMHLLERDRDRRAEGALPAPAGRRRAALVLRDDGARARRRVGPRRAGDDGDAGRRRLADRRPEVADHRRRGRRLRDRDGAHQRAQPRPGRDDVPRRRGEPGLPGRARDPDARPRDDRRPLRGRLRRLRRRRGGGPRRARPGLPLRPGAARARAADALHALARHRAPQPRHRARAHARPRAVRAEACTTSASRSS